MRRVSGFFVSDWGLSLTTSAAVLALLAYAVLS